ncbi:HI1506-related protein [Desulfocurvibacter africanus]|uniref:Mu-like prophage FluMu N-terminal domain-containing protein n=1 Tax=Desulfocurvibacter africanus subsp. africanus str. Walvis Bay TaxID=690850 RepID=F3YW14_DESAF|nr:HI1506-related protein [Desulfocurvibacter africanus]EGJ49044.1 hypothetical protein Desaf_0692 [Desulfocurvibacter africanus subsp. africanus str. Walvis Bay]
MNTQNKTTAKPEFVEAVRVVAKRNGFRRAGRAWSASGEVVPLSELTKEQLDALCAEPNLVVQFTEIPVETKPADKVQAPDPWPDPPEQPKDEQADSPETKELGKAKKEKK